MSEHIFNQLAAEYGELVHHGQQDLAAWVADVRGRVFEAAKRRSRDGVRETFYPAGEAPSYLLIKGLLAVAYATGMADHGLPGPPPLAN